MQLLSKETGKPIYFNFHLKILVPRHTNAEKWGRGVKRIEQDKKWQF
jgi:hypothetical protein